TVPTVPEPCSHVLAELDSLDPLLSALRLDSSRLKCTSLAASRRWLALGTSAGALHLLQREGWKQRLILTHKVRRCPPPCPAPLTEQGSLYVQTSLRQRSRSELSSVEVRRGGLVHLDSRWDVPSSREKFWRIGNKERDGEYGACFFPQTRSLGGTSPLICCARPGSRVWEASFSGEVLSTHQFKQLLACAPLPLVTHRCEPQYSPAPRSPQSIAFPRLLFLSDQYLLTWTDSAIYIFVPQSAQVLLWTEVKDLADVAVVRSELFCLHGDGRLSHLSFLPVERCVERLLRRESWVLAATVCCLFQHSIAPCRARKALPMERLEHLKAQLDGSAHRHLIGQLEEVMSTLEPVDSASSSRRSSISSHESFNVLDCGIYRVISRKGSQSDEDTSSLVSQSLSEEERLRELSSAQEEEPIEQEPQPSDGAETDRAEPALQFLPLSFRPKPPRATLQAVRDSVSSFVKKTTEKINTLQMNSDLWPRPDARGGGGRGAGPAGGVSAEPVPRRPAAPLAVGLLSSPGVACCVFCVAQGARGRPPDRAGAGAAGAEGGDGARSVSLSNPRTHAHTPCPAHARTHTPCPAHSTHTLPRAQHTHPAPRTAHTPCPARTHTPCPAHARTHTPCPARTHTPCPAHSTHTLPRARTHTPCPAHSTHTLPRAQHTHPAPRTAHTPPGPARPGPWEGERVLTRGPCLSVRAELTRSSPVVRFLEKGDLLKSLRHLRELQPWSGPLLLAHLHRLYERHGELAVRSFGQFYPTILPADVLAMSQRSHFLAYLDNLVQSQPEERRPCFLASLLQPEALRQDWLELALSHDAPQRADTLTPDGRPRWRSHLFRWGYSRLISLFIGLPADLASKQQMAETCRSHGFWLGYLSLCSELDRRAEAFSTIAWLDDMSLLEGPRGVVPESVDEWKLLLQLSQRHGDQPAAGPAPGNGVANGSADRAGRVSPENVTLRLACVVGPDRALSVLEECGARVEPGPRSGLVCELLRVAERRQRALIQAMLERCDRFLWSQQA
uniref:Hermansky-Pudlak syndrome 5 protein homolog n=1 Tax=Lepisosteus oculatus TaxID=7918 RepID=W5MIL6_LEPOC